MQNFFSTFPSMNEYTISNWYAQSAMSQYLKFGYQGDRVKYVGDVEWCHKLSNIREGNLSDEHYFY